MTNRSYPDTAKTILTDCLEYGWAINTYWDYTARPDNPPLIIEANNGVDNLYVVYRNRGYGPRLASACINENYSVTYKQIREFIRHYNSRVVQPTLQIRNYENIPLEGLDQ